MPTYDYRCKKGHVFELFHGMRDESAKRCPKCGSRARRVPGGGAGLLFKGSGFYITDYRSQSYRDRAKQEKPAGSDSGGAKQEKPAGSDSGGAKKQEKPSGSGGEKKRSPDS
ncbi:MAG: zinc ribbon domain-containing protein [Candidatus Eisenbacteria bacterium]|nr:zinc ribbon domain-containing protein [Candidatus Eisenbacteria bacterium]